MSTTSFLIAGFGGQGVLFAGKFLAYKGLIEDKQVSWLPSYGPEMRGGTANCSVIISDESVGSPIVNSPDVLVVMNLPSLDKYESSVVSGGKIIVDSTLIERKVNRTDVDVFYIPATKMANEMNMQGLGNMILMGKLIKECDIVSDGNIDKALTKVVSAKRQNLFDLNLAAINAGFNYEG